MERRNYLKLVFSLLLSLGLLFYSLSSVPLLAQETKNAEPKQDVSQNFKPPRPDAKLVEELNLFGETLAELLNGHPGLAELTELKARVYLIENFKWDTAEVEKLTLNYESELKHQGWQVMSRKVEADKAELNMILQPDARKGLFVLQLSKVQSTPPSAELTLVKLMGKFSLAAIEELKMTLQAKWKLDSLSPFQRASKFAFPETAISPSELRRIRTEPKVVRVMPPRADEYRRQLEAAIREAEAKASDLSKIQVEKALEEYRRRLEAEIHLLEEKVRRVEVTKVYVRQGGEYEREGNPAKALEQYQKILNEFPDASDRYIIRSIYGLAYNHEFLGNLNKAKQRYEELINKYGGRNYFVPAAEAALKRIADGETTQPAANEEAQTLLRQAESSIYNDCEYRKAIQDYQTLIDKYPSTIYAASAQFMMGMCYGWLFEPQKQIQALEKTADNYPSASAHYYLASAYQRQGRFKEALEQYKVLLQNYPDTYYWQRLLADYNIAQCLESSQSFGDAIEQYDKFLAQYEESAEFKELIESAWIASEKLKRGVDLPFLGVGLRLLGGKVVVNRVISGSAAEGGGIQKGDAILAIDEESVTSPQSVVAAIVKKQIGDTVRVTILRKGAELEVQAVLGRMLR